MFKSKAIKMHEAGQEKLCYDVCRGCLKEQDLKKIRDKYGDEDEDAAWLKYHDDNFGEDFIYLWETEEISCPVTHDERSVYEEPPKNCPHRFEHVVGLVWTGVLKEEEGEEFAVSIRVMLGVGASLVRYVWRLFDSRRSYSVSR